MKKLLDARRVLAAVLALGLFGLGAQNVVDPDVYWHLRTGQLILHNRAVFHSDPYSFTRLGQPWINHEWLSDVFIFAIYRAAGWAGLIALFGGLAAAIFLLVFRRCPGRSYVGVLATVWAGLVAAPLLGVRPQTISLLLVALFLLLLDLANERPKLLWSIPPLILLWVNLHAGYVAGIALLVWALAGHALDGALGFELWSKAVSNMRRLAWVLAGSLAVVPLNPYGASMYGYPLATLRSPAMQRHIAEWFSPDFHQAQYWPALLMILCCLGAIGLVPRRIRPRDLCLLLASLYMALHSVRNVALFAIVAAPILTGLAEGWLQERRRHPPHASVVRAAPTRKMLLNAALLLVFAAYTGVRVRSLVSQQANVEAAQFPVAAVNFLASRQPAPPLFNEYDWGGYLIWRLYPQSRVFIDGRADLYGDAFMDRYAATAGVNRDWEAPLQMWNVHTAILRRKSALAVALEARGWKEIYLDSQAVILTRK